MHDTEKTFLHFPGVLCAEDNHFPSSKIKINASGRCHVVSETVTWKLSGIVYSEVRSTKILQLFRTGSDTPVTNPVIDFFLHSWDVLHYYSDAFAYLFIYTYMNYIQGFQQYRILIWWSLYTYLFVFKEQKRNQTTSVGNFLLSIL